RRDQRGDGHPDRVGAGAGRVSRQAAGQLDHRSALRAADDRGGADPARALRAELPDRRARRVHEGGGGLRAALRHAAVCHTGGPAGPAGAGSGDGGGRGVAGAPNHRIFRSIILPNLTPALVAGCALAFARAIGEFGSLVLLTGNIPFKTEVASVYIYGRI